MQRAEGGPAFNTRAAKVDAGRPVTPHSEITENSLAMMATDKPLSPQQFSGSQDDAMKWLRKFKGYVPWTIAQVVSQMDRPVLRQRPQHGEVAMVFK